MFIGRERELNALERLYQSNKFEFAVIYGRRRVGKTALINKFIDDKNAIYFMGVESNAKQNLENLSKSIMEYVSGTGKPWDLDRKGNGLFLRLINFRMFPVRQRVSPLPCSF